MPRAWLRRPHPAEPRSVMGLWLRAAIAGDKEVRKQLSARLNGGKLGFNRDEAAVVQAACELAARRLWGSDYDVRAITADVSLMRNIVLQRGRKPPAGQLEMEAVIRAALGETDVDTSGIPRPLAFEIQMVVTAFITIKLKWPEPDVNQLLAEAEHIARERGWNPPLAS